MWRLIFLGLIIWLIIHVIKRHIFQSGTSKSDENNAPNQNNSENSNIEDMVQCATCAVHLPRSEAFLVDGNLYCCKAHIQKK